MKQPSRLVQVIMFALAMGMTAGGGWVHGHFRQRWGAPEELQAAARRLEAFPNEIGPWKGIRDFDLTPREQAILHNAGHLGRIFQHESSGQQISCSILLGPAGPMSVHTPEVCLGSQQFRLVQSRSELSVPGRDDAFWTATFCTTDVAARPLRSTYAWRYDEPWTASEHPRLTFGTRPFLYKIHLTVASDDEQSRKATEQFLRDALPVIDSFTLP